MAEAQGKSPEEFRKWLKGVVDGPYVGRPETCMSRKRIYDLSKGDSRRAQTEDEVEHLKSCVFCGDELSAFQRINAKKVLPAAR